MICEWVLLISFSKNYSRINTIELHSNIIGKFLTWNFFKESSSLFGIFHSNVFDGTLENQEVLGIDIDAQLFKFLQIGWRTDYVSINSVFCRGTNNGTCKSFFLVIFEWKNRRNRGSIRNSPKIDKIALSVSLLEKAWNVFE